MSLTAASTSEESDEDEELDGDDLATPEEQYAEGEISLREYRDIKGQQRVDALHVLTEKVTGIDFSDPNNRRKTQPLKTIGFIQ
jgi:hypothetical protein